MDKLVTIYRIEDGEGFGMYGSQLLHENLWDKATGGAFDECHVMPSDDGLSQHPWSWKFAFKDETQLKGWVYKKEWLENMHNLGGKIIMLLIPYEFVWNGGHQVIYDPYEVIEKLEMSLLEI